MDDEWSAAARELLAARYLRRTGQGEQGETVDELFWRVARAIAAADAAFPVHCDEVELAERFHAVMVERRFLPNSPTLFNAGTELGQLLACFVLPVPDSLDGIFTTLHDAVLIQQSGGGTGFSFSHLRPRGDLVRSTGRPSSGPVSFIRVFDVASAVIAGESVRGGANMGVLRVDHPDIREFIAAKQDPTMLTRFNLAVGVSDAFMRAAAEGGELPLVNPRDGAVVGALNAAEVLDEIAQQAHALGDPGLLFLDRVERDNPTPSLGSIEATNPCGEVPLLPYEACCLGSVNLAAFVRTVEGQTTIDEERLRETVALGVHFLDNVVEVSHYPLARIAEVCRANRKIGIGVMGLADLLIALGVPYGSPECLRIVDRLMGLVARTAVAASRELAAARGPFPNFPVSRFAASGQPARRNATVTSVAPTGSISLIAGCSSGIEPLYALAYRRAGILAQLVAPHPQLLAALHRIGRDDPELIADVEVAGRIGHRTDLPVELRQLFRVAPEIPPAEHLAVQAAVQRHVENAVSKTINLPADATVAAVRAAFVDAHRLGCKGITVYRDGSRPEQVLQVLGHCLSCVGENRIPVVSGLGAAWGRDCAAHRGSGRSIRRLSAMAWVSRPRVTL